MQLKGDKVDEMQLEQVLDRARHNVILVPEGCVSFNGAFVPVKMDYYPAALVPVEFEKKLLSFYIERGCNFIVSKIGRTSTLYICYGKIDGVSNLIDGVYTFQRAIKCAMKIARSGGDYGVWSAQYTDASSYESNIFMKFEISETLKVTKKTLQQLRDFV